MASENVRSAEGKGARLYRVRRSGADRSSEDVRSNTLHRAARGADRPKATVNKRRSQRVLARRWWSLGGYGSAVAEDADAALRATAELTSGAGRSRWDEAFVDEPTRGVDAVSTDPVREKAVVTDTNEPWRQYVQQKAAEELVGIEFEQFLGVTMSIIAITEADALAVEGGDP